MKLAPALVDLPDDHSTNQLLLMSAVRYRAGQPLCLVNGNQIIRRTKVAHSIAGPVSSFKKDDLKRFGYNSRGALLDALEEVHGDTVDLDQWVTLLTWEAPE